MERLLTTLKRIIPRPLLDAVRPAYHYAFGVLAAIVYRFPTKRMTVIGVTGTNGKSTTANLIAAVLETAGHQVGLATTVNFQIGERKWLNETKMTSRGRFATQKLLRQMADAGCTHAVLEVSSHALHWHRVWGIRFQTAVFTNLSRDHLDLHKTMEAYRNTKGKLFAALAGSPGSVAVVNGDDPEAPYFLKCLADRKFVFGTTNAVADILPLAHTVIASDIRSDARGSRFVAQTESQRIPLEIHLPGKFNISNALAAVSVGLAHEVTAKQIGTALASVEGVPGRMERVEAGQPFTIIVDYAHTPDAFDNVLGSLKESTPGRLISVFGATGDRDRGKRPLLGKVAATHSDLMYLTEEDPGSENPAEIIKEILPGIGEAGKSTEAYKIEPDRRAAIRAAVAEAKKGDTVALLAKGHETVMTYADGKRPWDDRVVAREEWQKLGR